MIKKSVKSVKKEEIETLYDQYIKARRQAFAWLSHALNGLGHPENCQCELCVAARDTIALPLGDASGAPHRAGQESRKEKPE